MREGRLLGLEGMKEALHNRGSLCARAHAAPEWLYSLQAKQAPLSHQDYRPAAGILATHAAYGRDPHDPHRAPGRLAVGRTSDGPQRIRRVLVPDDGEVDRHREGRTVPARF